jgi:chemosensory pili system protein ChpA (sensor histidine kinase/response regulator)
MENLKQKTVFLVEDSLAYRIIVQRILERNGFTVLNFDNGKTASEMFEYMIPDLIISDIQMPIMDGFEFHKFVKENYNDQQIPFIYLSSITSKKVRKKAKKLGATNLLGKNISRENLQEKVEQALGVAV